MIANKRQSLFSYIIRPVIFSLVICGVFGLVGLRSSIRAAEYRIGELEGEMSAALMHKRALVAKRASVLSIGLVSVQRSSSLGLGYPDRDHVFSVKTNRVDYKVSHNVGQSSALGGGLR